jgi:sugar phosphate isomerase/epimerase
MHCLLFTKLLKGLSLDEVGHIGADLGFDGIDLLVRPGHQLQPSAALSLQPAVELLRGYGLTVPAITTDLIDARDSHTELLFDACATAGVGLIRLGYWKYGPGDQYRTVFARARHQLDGLVQLADRYRVRPMIQLHGGTIHSSGSLAAQLLEGHDPALLGAYPDPGNQATQSGREDWRLTFDLLEPWLCMVGVKNGGWSFGAYNANGQRQWSSDWLGLPEGMVPWDDVLAALAHDHSAVPLSFHSHYELPLTQALDQTRTDLQYVRRIAASRVGDGRVALAKTSDE